MTAVVEIAKERRVGLAAELAKLDDFIRLAEALAKYSQGSGRDPVMDADGAAPRVLLADRGHDADLISEDMAARDGVAVTETTIEEPATVEDGVLDVSLQSDPAHNKAGDIGPHSGPYQASSSRGTKDQKSRIRSSEASIRCGLSEPP